MLKDVLIDNLQIIILCSIIISAIFDLIMKTNLIDALIKTEGKDDSRLQTAKVLIGFASALIVTYVSGFLEHFLDTTGFIILASCLVFSVLLAAISIKRNIAPMIIIFLALMGLYLMYTISNPPIIFDLVSDPLDEQILSKTVKFTGRAEDINDDPILYQFWVDNNMTRDWSKSNSWTWDTWPISEMELNPYGKYNITICAKDGKYNNIIDDKRSLNYTLTYINITNPLNGRDVPVGTPYVNGTSVGILPNEKDKLWIFVKNSRTNFHPQNNYDLHIDKNGNWWTMIDLGGRPGQKAEIVAVVANASAIKDINNYYIEHNNSTGWPGLTQLPVGAVEADYITINITQAKAV